MCSRRNSRGHTRGQKKRSVVDSPPQSGRSYGGMLGKRGNNENLQRNYSTFLSSTHTHTGAQHMFAFATSVPSNRLKKGKRKWSSPGLGAKADLEIHPASWLCFFHYHTQIVEILQLFCPSWRTHNQSFSSTWLGQLWKQKLIKKKLLCNFMRFVLFFWQRVHPSMQSCCV